MTVKACEAYKVIVLESFFDGVMLGMAVEVAKMIEMTKRINDLYPVSFMQGFLSGVIYRSVEKVVRRGIKVINPHLFTPKEVTVFRTAYQVVRGVIISSIAMIGSQWVLGRLGYKTSPLLQCMNIVFLVEGFLLPIHRAAHKKFNLPYLS